ncbi:hypothetical protein [Streptomyces fumanus]|nr:hypothetical protein [Streptomyces fumanus]
MRRSDHAGLKVIFKVLCRVGVKLVESAQEGRRAITASARPSPMAAIW